MRVLENFHRNGNSRGRPRGFTLLEMTIAVGMLAVLLSTSVQMLRVVRTQQRAAERRALANQTVQALAEQIGNLPWDDVTQQTLRQLSLPETAAAQLPAAELVVTVAEESAGVTARRVAIELRWSAAAGRPAGPVRLTTWVFPE